MAQTPPKTKSVVRAASSALNKDAKARDRAAKKGTTLDSFVNFSMNLGVGAQNAMTTSSYGFNPITRNRTLLEWVHRGSWLGGVAVDVVADDMTRAGVELKGTLKPDDISKIEEVATSLDIWNQINETIKWSRLYGGAIAVMLIDGQDPQTPLRLNTIRKDQFRGLLVLDRWMVEPSLSDLVTEYGPHMGLPKYYRVTANAPGLSKQTIHYSRCLRLDGVRLPYWQRLMENLWGISVIERMYDRMIAFDSASTGAAQLVYKSYLRTFKVENMREVVAAGGDAAQGLIAYTNMMRQFQGIEGMTMIDKNDEFEAQSHSAFGGLSDALAQFGQQLAGALQIPLVRLFGQSPAGFSTGDSDLRNYYDTIKQQQEKTLHTSVVKIYRAIAASEDIELPDGFGVEFRPLWQLTDREKADIAEVVGRTVGDAEERGLIDRHVALQEMKQSAATTGIFDTITEKMIKEAELEGPPTPEEVEVAEIHAEGQVEAAEIRSDKKEPPNAAAKDAAGPAAGILFRLPDNRCLLLLRGAGGDFAGTFGLPGGRIEGSETPEEAARRETLEETGFAYSGDLELLDSGDGSFTTYLANINFPFDVKLNNESAAYLWINPYEADKSITLHPGLKKTLGQ